MFSVDVNLRKKKKNLQKKITKFIESHRTIYSRSGAVFGWGKNTFGQLGIGDENPRHYPTQLKTLRSIGVRKISAGEDFSVFLTNDGGVFSCGAGNFGQLGHGNKNNVSLPRMVVEMMGTQVTQVSCGNRHTLTYVPSRGRMFGFGLNSSGQLGSLVCKFGLKCFTFKTVASASIEPLQVREPPIIHKFQSL